MSLFAIGDLHMSGGDDKPMDVFGPQWDRHFFRIRENWLQRVGEEDTTGGTAGQARGAARE